MGCLCSELSRTPRSRVAPYVSEPLLGRSRGRSARAAPPPTCWAVLLLQRQAGCPDPAPRSDLDPCFWDAVPDASGANGRLRRARVTRTLEFDRVSLSPRDDRDQCRSLRFTFSIVDQTCSAHAARSARAPTLLAPRTSPLQHRIARALEALNRRSHRQRATHNTPGARQQHASRRQSPPLNADQHPVHIQHHDQILDRDRGHATGANQARAHIARDAAPHQAFTARGSSPRC